jgi:hypothetical protein
MSRLQFKSFLLTWSVIIGISSTLLAIPSSGEMIHSLNKVFAQNQTVANQTAGTAGQNQTVANTTRQEFQPLEDALSEARTALHENNTGIAYRALSTAQDEIFDLTHVSQGEPQGDLEVAKAKALEEQLTPVRDSVNQAREGIWNNEDVTSPLNAISSAEVSLLGITETLSPGEAAAAVE